MRALGENGVALLAVAAVLLGGVAWTVWLPGKLYLWLGRLGGAMMFWGASGVFGAVYISVRHHEEVDPAAPIFYIPVWACLIGVLIAVWVMAPYWDGIRDGVKARLSQEAQTRNQEEK